MAGFSSGLGLLLRGCSVGALPAAAADLGLVADAATGATGAAAADLLLALGSDLEEEDLLLLLFELEDVLVLLLEEGLTTSPDTESRTNTRV